MPPYDPEIHHRRSIRLHGYDYRSDGTYFITLCTVDRSCRFGRVVDGEVVLSEECRIVDATWRWLASNHEYIQLGSYVVMPNHLHGIIARVADEGGSRTAPTSPAHKPLGRLIGAFKTVSTKRVNELLRTPGDLLWQRNYWEHIVRTDDSMAKIEDYILNNPRTWESDQLFVRDGRVL